LELAQENGVNNGDDNEGDVTHAFEIATCHEFTTNCKLRRDNDDKEDEGDVNENVESQLVY
jgi:hypothetical protein